MKIGSPEYFASVSALSTDRTTAGSAKKTNAAVQDQDQDDDSTTVELSSTAVQLQSSGALEGSFDAEKVQRIAQAIKDGKFQINPEKIADKLIANAQELLNGSSS